MYGTWRNLCGLQRARPWEPAFAQRQGCRRHEATYSMELHTCTTGTKTTMSNCNCEISMVRTLGINHCAKTGVSTTVKTATAELRHPSLTNNGHNSNLVRELHLEQEELDHGELPLRHNREVQKRAGTCRCTTKCEYTLSRNCNCGVSRNKHSKHCAYLSVFQQKPMLD